MSIKVVGFSLYGSQAASHRVRLAQFQPGLAAQGIELIIQSLLDDHYLQRRFSGQPPSLRRLISAYGQRFSALRLCDLADADLAIVHCELLPFLPGWVERQLLKIPFIYDCDDAFYLKYRRGRLRCLEPLLGRKFDHMMQTAFAVTAGNGGLAAYAKGFNPNVSLLPSVVDTDHYCPLDLVPAAAPFTVGWIGTPSTSPYLQQLSEPLRQLASELPVRLLVIGGPAPAIDGVQVIEQPWRLEDEVSLIQQFTVGVMPLPDSEWARGKCAYKLIQCMACGIPVIASSVGANVDAVPPSCGFLTGNPDEWLEAFRQLAADVQLRQRMGAAGRRWVEQRYSLRSALPVFTSVLRLAAANSLKV